MPFTYTSPDDVVPNPYVNRNLSDGQIITLSKIKLSNQDALDDSLRIALVKSYRDELNWVFKRCLAIGYNETVSFSCVKGFYARFLTKFITLHLTREAESGRARDINGITTENEAVSFYRGLFDTAHGNLYQYPMPNIPNQGPDARLTEIQKAENKKYITGARVLMLRDSFMKFMQKLKERLRASSANLSRVGLVTDGARIGNLTKVVFTGSDPHHGMQVVLILHYGNTKVVYKPRDTRVDELIIGRQHNIGTHPCAGSLGELLNSNGLRTGDDIADNTRGYAVPTYKFLSCGEYGFVEFLELDFSHSSDKHSKRFAWLHGVYAGMSIIFGLTDMHHGNIMLCKRNVTAERNKTVKRTRHCIPHMTDLEISFHDCVLGAGDMTAAYRNTGIKDGMTGTTETEYMNWFKFERNGTSKLIKKRGNAKKSNTDNLPRSGSNPIQLKGKDGFGDSFKNGLIKVFKILRSLSDETLDDFMDRFVGCKVRFHAMATGKQLSNIRLYAEYGVEITIRNNVAGMVDERQGPFKDSLNNDWNQFDVAYYVKHLGGRNSGQVDHISAGHNVVTIAGGAMVTGGDTFNTVRTNIKNLPHGDALEIICEAIKNKAME